MAIGSGLSAQFGMVAETAYGTFVTPTRFLEFNAESLEAMIEKIRTRSIGDRFQRTTRVRTWTRGGKGQLDLDVQNKGFGKLFLALLGNVATAQVGVTSEYVHTFTPDNTTGMAGLFHTVQIGKPDSGGTVRAFNFVGGKVLGWEMVAELYKNLNLKVDWDFKSFDNTNPLAAAALPSGSTPLSFIDGAVTIGGSSINIQKIDMKVVNQLFIDRFSLGVNKREPIANGEMVITGTIEMEFESLTQFTSFVNGTQAALVATFSYGTIPTASTPFQLIINLPAIEYEGTATPLVPNSDVIKHTLPFKALWDGTNPIISLVYHTSDILP